MEKQNELLINEAKSNNLSVKSNKQIEKMAKVIENKTKLSIIISTAIAEVLTVEGYRKASDVAREIFEEVDKKVKASLTIHLEEINKEHIKDTPLYDRHSGIIFALRQIEDFLAELKKKYIGEDINFLTKESEDTE
jgi:hypothetical protein